MELYLTVWFFFAYCSLDLDSITRHHSEQVHLAFPNLHLSHLPIHISSILYKHLKLHEKIRMLQALASRCIQSKQKSHNLVCSRQIKYQDTRHSKDLCIFLIGIVRCPSFSSLEKSRDECIRSSSLCDRIF